MHGVILVNKNGNHATNSGSVVWFSNFERPFTPRGWLRLARNFAKTRFRRSPTFHFSTPKTNFRRNFRIEISCFRYFGQVFVCTQHTCVLCLYTAHMCVVCIHNTHVCCVYTRQMASSFPSYGHQKVSVVTAVGEFLKQIQNRNAHISWWRPLVPRSAR